MECGKVIRDKANETVLVKNMADGSKVLALFNRSDVEELVIRVDWLETTSSWKQERGDLVNSKL